MQDISAYSNPKEQVVLQDNMDQGVVNEHIKVQENLAYGSVSKN